MSTDESPTPAFLPYQQRVVNEKSDTDTRVAKLEAFLFKETSASLPLMERNVLYRQLAAMKEYSDCLGERILMFGMNKQEKGL